MLESSLAGDGVCVFCGSLLWWFAEKAAEFTAADAAKFVENVENVEVDHTTSWVDDLGASSLHIVELVMEIEEEFEIEIPDNVATRSLTVGDWIRLVQGLRGRVDA